MNQLSQRLIDGLRQLHSIYPNLPLVPLNDNKQPLGDGWQNRPFTPAELIKAIEKGGVEVPIQGKIKKIQLQGYGILTGRPITINGATYYLMALDLDGASAADKILELSGGEALPKTVAFTSNRPGRCQFLFLVPEEYKDAIRTKKVKTGVIGDDGKPEQVEFRLCNLQSVLPPSVHPTTGQYHWVSGCAIDETEIALAPTWVIELMLVETSRGEVPLFNNSNSSFNSQPTAKTTAHSAWSGMGHKQWTDIDFANSYLNSLSSYRADDYDDWLTVGMALHSVSDSLLAEWDSWSQQSAKYKPSECEKKWKGFNSNGGVTLGTLAHLAKQDGWRKEEAGGRRQKAEGWKKQQANGGRQYYPGKENALEHLPNSFRPEAQSLYQNMREVEAGVDGQHHSGGAYFLPSASCLLPSASPVTGDRSNLSDRSNPDPLSLSATVTAVTTILKAGLKDYEERTELDAIGLRSVMSHGAFWELVRAVRCELDEVQVSDTDRLNKLIDWHNATLDLNKVLPQPLANAFSVDAAILNIDPVSLWQYFLPAVSSLAGKRVNLDIESHFIPAIAWTCIVGESGTGKTRAEGVVLAHLKHKQHQEKKRWKKELKEYQQTLKALGKDEAQPEPPRPERKYLFEVATIQAVMRRLAEQGENGSLWARDEIAGLFKSLGQFSSHRGENEGLECLLKMWDGAGSLVDRVDAENDSYDIGETRLSLAGGIQPGAFRQAFKDPDDPQGLQARFLYSLPKVYPAKRVKGYCLLSDILPAFYDWLDQLPTGSIKLSRDADLRYTNLVEQIGEQAEREANPAIRAWMRKLPTQLLRIALVLHLVDFYYDDKRKFYSLQLDTLERAVEVCRYYRSTFQVVQEKAADSDSISSILLKIWDMAVTQPDGVTPRDIYRTIKAIGRRAAELKRQVGAYTIELLSKLVEMGKGRIEKEGRFYRFLATFTPPDNPSDPDSPNPTRNPNPTMPDGDDFFTPDSQKDTTELEELETEKSSSLSESDQQGETFNEVKINDSSDTFMGQNTPLSRPLQQEHLLETKDNLPSPVTGVTEAKTEILQGVEMSPTTELSPVTVEENKQNHSEEISWLLEFLADLESTSTTHPRFTSNEQLVELFNEVERKANSCLEMLRQVCPDYFERAFAALDILGQALNESLI